MTHESVFARISELSAPHLGVFRGGAATTVGVSRKQILTLTRSGAVERVLPDTYRLTGVAPTTEQKLHAAMLWAGEGAVASGRSAGELYGLEAVRAALPEIIVPRRLSLRSAHVIVHRSDDRAAMMIRHQRGLPTTGVEATLLALAHALDGVTLERACEDARRRRLTSVPALGAYLTRFGARGRPGIATLRALLDDLDPTFPARSTLEVMTRRLLVAHGLTDFVRELPLTWNGRTHRFDFGFPASRTILETNGRRWHDDPADYEADNEKWSVPGRHGFCLIFATWSKVTRRPDELIQELHAAFGERGVGAVRGVVGV